MFLRNPGVPLTLNESTQGCVAVKPPTPVDRHDLEHSQQSRPTARANRCRNLEMLSPYFLPSSMAHEALLAGQDRLTNAHVDERRVSLALSRDLKPDQNQTKTHSEQGFL